MSDSHRQCFTLTNNDTHTHTDTHTRIYLHTCSHSLTLIMILTLTLTYYNSQIHLEKISRRECKRNLQGKHCREFGKGPHKVIPREASLNGAFWSPSRGALQSTNDSDSCTLTLSNLHIVSQSYWHSQTPRLKMTLALTLISTHTLTPMITFTLRRSFLRNYPWQTHSHWHWLTGGSCLSRIFWEHENLSGLSIIWLIQLL